MATKTKLDRTTISRLKKRPYYAYLYSMNMLKARLPENIEIVLADDAESAYLYAKNVIKGRLPDCVHNKLIIKTFENTESKEYVSKYLKECCE